MQSVPARKFDHSTAWAEAGRIKAHKSLITVVSFSPDGNYLASGDEDGYIFISRTNKLKHSFTIRTSGGGVRKLKWYPSKPSAFVVASANGDINKVRFVLHDTGPKVTFTDTLMGNVPGFINAFDINADGTKVAIGFRGTVMVLTMGSFENNTPASFSLVRSKEQRLVRDVFFISQEALGIVYVIDEENVLLAYSTDITHKFLWAIKKPINRPFSHRTGGCAVSPSGSVVAVMNLNGAIDFYYIPTRKLLLSVPFPQDNLCASDLVFVTDDTVLTGGGDGRLTFITMDPSQDPSYVSFDELGPQFQTLTFMWRSWQLFVASASPTESGAHPQVIVAKKLRTNSIPSPPLAGRDRNPEPSFPTPAIAMSGRLPPPVTTDALVDNAKFMELVAGSFSFLVIMGIGIHYSDTLRTYSDALRMYSNEIWQAFVRRLGHRDGFEDLPSSTPAATSHTTTATATTTVTRILRVTNAAHDNRNSNEGRNPNVLPFLYALGFGSVGALVSALFFVPSHRTRLVVWYQSAAAAFKAAFGRGGVEALADTDRREILTDPGTVITGATGGGQVENKADGPVAAASGPIIVAGGPTTTAGSEEGTESWVAMGSEESETESGAAGVGEQTGDTEKVSDETESW